MKDNATVEKPSLVEVESVSSDELNGLLHSVNPCLVVDEQLRIKATNAAANIIFTPGFSGVAINAAGNQGYLLKYITGGGKKLLDWIHSDDPRPIELAIHSTTTNCNFIVYRVAHYLQGQVFYTLSILPVANVQRLDNEQNIYQTAFQYSRQAIYISDSDNNIVAINPAFRELFGYSDQEILGKPEMMLVHPDSINELKMANQLLRTEGNHTKSRISYRRKGDGDEFSGIVCSASIVLVDGNNDGSYQFLNILENISDQVELERNLVKAAQTDVLTSISNRHGFNCHFQDVFKEAMRLGEQISLLYIDLDRFKYLNDNYGHDLGDLLLRTVAKRIQHSTRANDFVARIGGDEFLVLLQGMHNRHHLEILCEKLIESLNRPYDLNGIKFHCTCSIGVATYPDDALTPDALIKAADTAMYVAKNEGRNQYRFYRAGAEEPKRFSNNRFNEIQAVIDSNKIFAVYQPIHDLQSGKIKAFEALARCQLENGTIASPKYFMPFIEETHLAIDLAHAMVKQAAMQIKMLGVCGFHIPISVNLSSYQIRNEKLILFMEKFIKQYPDIGRLIRLEITETLIFEDDETVIGHLNRLSDAGFMLLLDDFGTGHSSVYSLRKLKFSAVKIDKSFIDDIKNNDREGLQLLSAIISIARALKVDMVCEGIETSEQIDYLVNNHCQLGQGYIYAKPMARSRVLSYIQKSKIVQH